MTPNISPAHVLGVHYGATPIFGGAWTISRRTWFIDRHGDEDCESEALSIRFPTQAEADQAARNLNTGELIDAHRAVAA